MAPAYSQQFYELSSFIMATVHFSPPASLFKSNNLNLNLSSSISVSQLPFHSNPPSKRSPTVTSSTASHTNSSSPYYPIEPTPEGSHQQRTKTKIVCTIGPSTSSPHMISKLAETGMNVVRLNMSHGDHASHQKTIDFVKQYNSLFQDRVISIMLDTKVNSFPFISNSNAS